MKQHKDLLVYGTQVFRNLMGQHADPLSLEDLHHATARPAKSLSSRRRVVLEGGNPTFDDESIDKFLSRFFDRKTDLDIVKKSLDRCDIDVEDMMTKVMEKFSTYPYNLTRWPTDPSTFPWTRPDWVLIAIPDLKDDDERECSNSDDDRLNSAMEDYSRCLGFNEFFEDGYLEFLQEDDCSEVLVADLRSMQGSSVDTSEIEKATMKCKLVLGDAPFGNFIRYQYNHLDKSLECSRKFSEDSPRCIMSTPFFDLPLSLLKKFECMIGTSSEDLIGYICSRLYGHLDECLPQIGQTLHDRDTVPLSCGEDERMPGGIDPSVVTRNKLPTFCSRVAKKDNDHEVKEIKARFDWYNKHREYGWTVEIANEELEPAEGANESKDKTSGQPQESYESNPVDVSEFAESASLEEGEAGHEVSSEMGTKSSSFAKVFIVATIIVALIVSHREIGAAPKLPPPPKYSDNNFSDDGDQELV